MRRRRNLRQLALGLERAEVAPLRRLAAQLPTLMDAPPVGPDWLHEIKYDGWRLIAEVRDGRVVLLSRHDKAWHATLGPVCEAISVLGLQSARFDGELIAVSADGRSDFSQLQEQMRRGEPEGLQYVLFDLTYVEGVNIQLAPLIDRKELLQEVLAGSAQNRLSYSTHVIGHGARAFALARKSGVEGVVSKRVKCGYRPGRSRDWIKVKAFSTQSVVVVGYVPSRLRGVAAVLIAEERPDGLRYAGLVEHGLSSVGRLMLRRALGELEVAVPAIAIERPLGVRVRWVRPQVRVFVRHLGYEHGLLRHASLRSHV